MEMHLGRDVTTKPLGMALGGESYVISGQNRGMTPSHHMGSQAGGVVSMPGVPFSP